MNRAVALLAEAKATGRGRAAVKPIRTVGHHPGDEAPIELYEGRYGPYVKHGGINATVPRDLKPDELTLDQAVSLLAERAAKAPARSPRPCGPRRRHPCRPTTPATRRPARRRPPRRRRRPSARPPRPTRPRLRRRRAPGPMAKGRVPTRDELLAFIKESATPGRQARDRARLRAEGRPAHRAQGAPARPARIRRHRRRPRQDIQGSKSTD